MLFTFLNFLSAKLAAKSVKIRVVYSNTICLQR